MTTAHRKLMLVLRIRLSVQRILALLVFVGAATLLSACASRGPLVIEPDREFRGLRHLLDELDAGGTLHILVLHGMRADEPQSHQDLIDEVTQRLAPIELPGTQTVSLVATRPIVALDSVLVWRSDEEWARDAPRLTITTYQAELGKRVAFYAFDYWRPLATLKCRFLLGPDSKLVGPSDRGRWCEGNNSDQVHYSDTFPALSSDAKWLNRALKTELVEWGFADATIVVSDFRGVLRSALREAVALMTEQAISDGHSPNAVQSPVTKASLLTQQIAGNQARVAAITLSLGSYVLFDTLDDAISRRSSEGLAAVPTSTDATAAAQQLEATVLSLCSLVQVHMLANQLGLLRLSDLRVGSEAATPSGSDGKLGALRSCAPRAQVVAYHEPSDLLSMYALDPPDAVSQSNMVINVVKPFAKAVGFAADPIEAHTGHASQPLMMDLLVDGYCRGNCAATAADRDD